MTESACLLQNSKEGLVFQHGYNFSGRIWVWLTVGKPTQSQPEDQCNVIFENLMHVKGRKMHVVNMSLTLNIQEEMIFQLLKFCL